MCSALGGNEGVNLVNDDRVDGAQSLGCSRREHQVERFGGGDEDVGWVTPEASTFALRGVAGADADRRFVKGHAAATRHVGNAGKGRAQVAFDVDGQGLEGRDIDDAAAPILPFGQIVEHEPVQAPEEGCQGLAGAGGGENQGALPARDHRPAQTLRSGGAIKDGFEPLCCDGMEAGERIGIRSGVARGFRIRPAGRHACLSIPRVGSEEEAKEQGTGSDGAPRVSGLASIDLAILRDPAIRRSAAG